MRGRFSVLAARQRPTARRRAFEIAVAVGARGAVAGMSSIYAVLKLLPTRADKIVLMSRLYTATSQDFAAIAAEIVRQRPGARVVILNHRNTGPARVPLQVLTEMFHLATSRTCITDSYMAAISVLRHKDELVVIQLWHALGAIKRFGLAALGSAEGRPGPLARAMRMHHGYDWVITGGPRMVEPFAAAFGVPAGHVLPIGTPRVDLLLDVGNLERKRRRIAAAHPELGGRPIVLYAPTFRMAEPVHVEALLAAFDPDEFDVVVALHPLDKRDVTGRRGVVQDARFSTLDWLAMADCVVSDYSAIVFDAAVLGTPMYFFAYDLDDYRDQRGLFLDIPDDLPGPVLRTADAVVEAIRTHAAPPERVVQFRTQFVAVTDGSCTRRLVELAWGDEPLSTVTNCLATL